MEREAVRGPPGLLLLLLAALSGADGGGGLSDLPRPSIIGWTLSESHCLLNVSWTPVKIAENIPCGLRYHSALKIDGEWVQNLFRDTTFRTALVPLGKKSVFGVRTSCSRTHHGEWVNISLPEKGIAGTGATNIDCIWHNAQYVVCSWQRGRNAGYKTTYNLTVWRHQETWGTTDDNRYPVLEMDQQCTNYTQEGDTFRCAFDLKKDWPPSLGISIQGSSSDIQPVCKIPKAPDYFELRIKPGPPSIAKIENISEGVNLSLNKNVPWNMMCYEVEISNTEGKRKELSKEEVNIPIILKPKGWHTFRVRSMYTGGDDACTEGLWSDWSEERKWEVGSKNNTFSVLLYIFIPLCVAALSIIFLIYLKRIKLLILPTIPEPGKFLKQMFEEQNDDLQKPPPEDPIKDEQTHLLVFIQPPDKTT